MADAPEANNGPAKAEVSKAGWRKSITRQMPRVAAVGGAIAAVLVAGWVLIGDLKPDEAVVGTLVGLAALARRPPACSAPTAAAMSIECTTSAKRTVTCLYSADRVADATRVPHSLQNLAVPLN
jgi:hypothetical protein